jgi:hypothetical protein
LYRLSETQINKYGTALALPPVYKIPNNPSDKLAYYNNLKINNVDFDLLRETLNHMINDEDKCHCPRKRTANGEMVKTCNCFE